MFSAENIFQQKTFHIETNGTYNGLHDKSYAIPKRFFKLTENYSIVEEIDKQMKQPTSYKAP